MIGLIAALVLAHPQGFHKRVTFELWSTSINGLVVMDIDSGQRCALLRAGADVNRDGVLDSNEAKVLKKKLATMSTRALKLWISGHPVVVEVRDTKLTLKGDSRVSPTGVSIAVLLTAQLPYAVTPGMSLGLEDIAPDSSHVEVEVFQHGLPDAGPLPELRRSVKSAERVTVRLGPLASP